MKKYVKAEVIAKNASAGAYAAGCPTNEHGFTFKCKKCERTM